MIRILIFLFINLIFCSISFAQVSIPFPGPGGVTGIVLSKILATGDGKILVTSDGEFLKTPGAESWDKLLKTSDDKLLITGEGKVLKTP